MGAAEGDGARRQPQQPLLIAPTRSNYLEEPMRYLWVGLGGACGSIVRYAIGLGVDQSHFPWATLGINLSGAFVLGLFLTLALGQLSVAVITPVAVGLIGGFTTFSTFAWEGFTHARSGRAGIALVYVSVSVVGGLVAAWGGYSLGRVLS
jgi:fluoride exporter